MVVVAISVVVTSAVVGGGAGVVVIAVDDADDVVDEVRSSEPEHAATSVSSTKAARHRVVEAGMPGRTYCRVAAVQPR
jgi:hypothetical protein